MTTITSGSYLINNMCQGSVEDEEIMVWFSAGTCVSFVINKNMTVVTKQLQYPPLNNNLCWNFATRGKILWGHCY